MAYADNIFTDDKANWLPILGILLTIILTFLATTGVKKFSTITDIGGKVMMATVVCFVFFAILGYVIGKYPSAWEFNAATVVPKFDADYFSTFSWLLLAVAGAEVSGTYINQIGDSKKIFPKSVLVAALCIAGAYIIGSVAVCLIASPATLENEGVKSVTYVVFKILGDNWGLNGTIILHIYGGIAALSAIGAYIIWLDSPISAMFAELPEGTLPGFFKKRNEKGILANALWTQCGLLVFMMLTTVVSAFGTVNGLVEYLYTATGTATVIPYIFLAAAYMKFKSNNGVSASTIIKSKNLGIAMAVVTICLGLAGFIGTGWYGWQGAETTGAAVKALFDTYGVTILLVVLGYVLVVFAKVGKTGESSMRGEKNRY
jgi:amino acid transporter